VFDIEIFVKDKTSIVNVVLLSVGFGLSDTTICTSYFMLAEKYEVIAEKIPQKFSDDQSKP